jgi:hypothetical protein
MRRKARLADESEAGVVVATPVHLHASIDRCARRGGDRRAADGSGREEHALPMTAGLLRVCCGLRFHEIARRLGCSTTRAHDLVTTHLHRLEHDVDYAAKVGVVASEAIRATFGVRAIRSAAAVVVETAEVRESP